MLSTSVKPAAARATKGYLAIPLATIIPESTSGIRLYLKDLHSASVRLFRAEGTPFRNADRQRLLESGVKQLLIRASDQSQYQDYLRNNLSEILNGDRFSPQQRFGTLSEVTRHSLSGAFHTLKMDETVRQVSELAEHCVELFSRDDYVAEDLLTVLCHDFQTFTHSVNVAFFSVLLARALSMTSHQMLLEIAVGGFLHDLGKLSIPSHILMKPGQLTEAEYKLVQDHPRNGFMKLCGRGDLTYGQLMMVYQHHERIDGRGYPVGSVGASIHDWAKICAVADVFEALSANRPFRVKYRVPEVMQIMERDCGLAFEEEIFQCWKNAIAHSSINY